MLVPFVKPLSQVSLAFASELRWEIVNLERIVVDKFVQKFFFLLAVYNDSFPQAFPYQAKKKSHDHIEYRRQVTAMHS